MHVHVLPCRPQEIDEAARRRLVKRLYIPLPDFLARKQIVTNLLRQQLFSLTAEELELICRHSDGKCVVCVCACVCMHVCMYACVCMFRLVLVHLNGIFVFNVSWIVSHVKLSGVVVVENFISGNSQT